MSIAHAILLALAVVFLHSALLGFSVAWLPMPFIAVMFIFFNTDDRFALYFAAATGLVLDVHYWSAGPLAIALWLTVVTLERLRERFLVHQPVWSVLFLTVVGSVEYFILTFAVSGFINGLAPYFSRAQLLITTVAAVYTITIVLIAQMLFAGLVAFIKRYARRSV